MWAQECFGYDLFTYLRDIDRQGYAEEYMGYYPLRRMSLLCSLSRLEDDRCMADGTEAWLDCQVR